VTIDFRKSTWVRIDMIKGLLGEMYKHIHVLISAGKTVGRDKLFKEVTGQWMEELNE
jgi:hypothetical protein